MVYKCGNCGYIGECFGTVIAGSHRSVVSAPRCSRCGKNDKLEKQEDKSKRKKS